jgi:hypothetical protein
MPLFVTHFLHWTRRHPVLALLLGGGLGLIVYWQMAPSPGMPGTQKLAQARTVPGLSGERVTLEKTLLDVQRENEQLRLSLDEHRHTLVRLEQAQQRQERERQDQLAAQERRLEEALQRAQAPPPTVAPPPPQRPAALPRLSPAPPAPASPAPTIRILRSDKPPSFGGPGPTLPRADAPYLPPGSYAVGTLVTGVFATSRVGGALPVLFAVSAPFAGPFHFVTGAPPVATALPVQGCLVLGKAQADLAALRVVVQLTTLSCVFPDGQTFERPLVGYATGQDGTLGLPGRLETREGAYLAKTFLTSLLAGAGEAFALAKRTVVVTPFGGTISTQSGNVGEMAGYAALAQAAARLSEWYLGQADKLLPVLWAESGMPVRLVLQEGVALDGLPTTATLMQGGQ